MGCSYLYELSGVYFFNFTTCKYSIHINQLYNSNIAGFTPALPWSEQIKSHGSAHCPCNCYIFEFKLKLTHYNLKKSYMNQIR